MKLKNLGTARRFGTRAIGEFELKCLNCDKFICMSSNVRRIRDAHHVVVDETLVERVKLVKGPSQTMETQDQINGKMICQECGGNLGVICIYKNLEFPVLKIENFLIVDRNGRQNTSKKWNKVPFVVQELTITDLQAIAEKRGGTGDI